MIIEDNPAIITAFTMLLEDTQWNIQTPGKDFKLASPDGTLPHLILLDMLLWGKDGKEIARSLKKDASTKHIPIIMMSAYPDGRKQCLDAGADSYIAKPCSIDELFSTMAKYA